MSQPTIVFVVHFKEKPAGIQWDREFPTKPEALAFAEEVEQNGGIAIIVEAEGDDDGIVLGNPDTDEEEDPNG